jgi:hypothetical protein
LSEIKTNNKVGDAELERVNYFGPKNFLIPAEALAPELELFWYVDGLSFLGPFPPPLVWPAA